MSEARQRTNWSHTSHVLAMLHSLLRIQCDPKKAPKPLGPEDFNPFAVKAKPPVLPLSMLKGHFTKRKPKQC